MDFILSRYRSLTVLLAVIGVQLVLLAYQVKGKEDMRLIRIWAVTAVTPVANLIEGLRGGSIGFLRDYVFLWSAAQENRRLKEEAGRLKIENQFLRQELATADRARALSEFQVRTPSKMIPARIIASGAGVNSRVVFVDRGTTSGVSRGMAVITPDGIVGRVLMAYPTASQVMLVTDSSFAAGVVSEKNHVLGTVRGQGRGTLLVDYVQNEEKVEPGERFYTSGDDRIFPRGLPVGEAKVVRPGRNYKEILLAPSGFRGGLEEVLIVIEGVHQRIPEAPPPPQPIKLLPPPPELGAPVPAPAPSASAQSGTEADRLLERYRRIGEAQGHTYGTSSGRIPDFNLDPNQIRPRPSPGAEPEATSPGVPAPGAAAPSTAPNPTAAPAPTPPPATQDE